MNKLESTNIEIHNDWDGCPAIAFTVTTDKSSEELFEFIDIENETIERTDSNIQINQSDDVIRLFKGDKDIASYSDCVCEYNDSQDKLYTLCLPKLEEAIKSSQILVCNI